MNGFAAGITVQQFYDSTLFNFSSENLQNKESQILRANITLQHFKNVLVIHEQKLVIAKRATLMEKPFISRV